MNNTTTYLALAIVAGIALVGLFGLKPSATVGSAGSGLYNSNPLFSQGLRVGTSNIQAFDNAGNLTATAISASGALSGTSITGTSLVSVNGTSTSTVSVGNTGVGKLCLWNGANYSIISFASGSTTVGVATSTSCN